MPLARSMALLIGGLLLVGTLSRDAAAQPSTGTVTGRVVLCRDDEPSPVGATSEMPSAVGADPGGGLMQDLPAPGGSRHLAALTIPSPGVLVMIDGTELSARTDDAGRFAVAGVPAGQSLTVSTVPGSSGSMWAQVTNVRLDAGQTLDIGLLVVGTSTAAPCSPGPEDRQESPAGH